MAGQSSASTPPPTPTPLGQWKGTERYEVRRCIGQGAMGAVYEALDRQRGRLVALKTLLHFSPAGLYLFKQEFRALADVSHPNLVHLYELVASEAEHVFFTMELVRGTDFVVFAHKASARPSSDPSSEVRTVYQEERQRRASRPGGRDGELPLSHPPRGISPADCDKLRPALHQLVEGVQALHAAGKLHRDIKPSNVLVTGEGRVVLLDFGVATELSSLVDENFLEEGQVVGTAHYMAPEQGTGDASTPACDWYGVGAILYEALVGSPPFVGNVMDVITMKNRGDPPA